MNQPAGPALHTATVQAKPRASLFGLDDDAPSGEMEQVICGHCSGSGEGMYDGSTCSVCRGKGEVWCEVEAEPVDTADEAVECEP